MSRYSIHGIVGNFIHQGYTVLAVGQDDHTIHLLLLDDHQRVKTRVVSVVPEEIPLPVMLRANSQTPGLILLEWVSWPEMLIRRDASQSAGIALSGYVLKAQWCSCL